MKVPWISKAQISEKALALIENFQTIVGYAVKPPIPVEDIIERYLGLRLSYDDLEKILGARDVLGATYVKSRLICVNEKLFEHSSEGRLVFTCAHEVGHWILHRRYVNVQGRFSANTEVIVCRARDTKEPIEWQADYFAACLLMPETEVKEASRRAFGEEALVLHNVKSSFGGTSSFIDPCVENWHFMAEMVREAGGFTNVSKHAMIIRLQELGLLINLTGGQMGWQDSFKAD
jgi:hypothetical protein